MEDNNDFEKYEGYKDSAETLLGTNEKSSSMSSRERVDDAVEEAGAEFLSKYGVPKELGKKAVKSNGGKLSPTNYGVNKLAKNYTRNKAAKGLEKLDKIKKKNNSNNSNDQTSQRINQSKQRRSLFGRNKSSSNDEVDSGDANTTNEKSKSNNDKKSNVNKGSKNEPSLKSRLKDFISRDKAKATSESKFPIKKIVKIKLALILSTILILIVIVPLFFIEFVLGPIMDAWGYVDEAITGVADFSEKLSNFYYGFGFQDSKEAFYDELDTLCDRYTCANDGTGLDVPMILSTLFYTEGMGYDTKFNNTEESAIIDASMNGLGTNSGLLSVIQNYVKEKIDEAHQTVDENGLVYNAGKIYRLRKLARNQFNTDSFGNPTRQGVEREMSLSAFLDQYGSYIVEDIKNLLDDLRTIAAGVIQAPFKALVQLILGEEYTGGFFDDMNNVTTDFVDTFKQLLGDIFYGILDVTDIDISLSGITITYKTWSYDEDNYEKYLKDYYFEYVPEYKSLLGSLSGDARDKKKDEIFNAIKENKKLFKDIFLQYQNSNSENYVNNCVGAIDSTLVSGLSLPVDIPENTQISFGDEYAFGVVNGRNHNGVDLNRTTAGVDLGSIVYSVANGKVDSITNSNSCTNNDSCGKTVRISHDIIIDNQEFKFYTAYSNIVLKNTIRVGTTVTKGEQIGTIYSNISNTEGLHFVFMDASSDSSGVAIDPTNLFIPCTQGGTFSGSTNEEAVWNYLLGLGYTRNATAGIMGNMSVESANTFDGRIVQGDYDSNLTYSIEYTNKVDTGRINRTYFAHNGPNGGGYGIVQWTYYTLKEGLYDYSKNERRVSVGDTAMQIDYLNKYLQSNNQDLYNLLRQSNISIDSATRSFMLQFENPADQSEEAQSGRVQRAQDIYNRYANR